MTEIDIERRRQRYGMPMSELAVRAGLPYSRVWHGLRGTKLSPDELRKLERAIAAIEQTNYAAAV